MNKDALRRKARMLAALAFIASWLWLMNDWATPEQCKVPHEEMNSFCKDLIYN